MYLTDALHVIVLEKEHLWSRKNIVSRWRAWARHVKLQGVPTSIERWAHRQLMCKNKILIFNIYTVKIFNLTADKKILIKTTSFSFLPIKLVIIFKTYYPGWKTSGEVDTHIQYWWQQQMIYLCRMQVGNEHQSP